MSKPELERRTVSGPQNQNYEVVLVGNYELSVYDTRAKLSGILKQEGFDVVLRPGIDIGKSNIHSRMIEALAIQSRGIVQDIECEFCKQRRGPFLSCIALSEHWNGTCGNCYRNGRRCSAAKDRSPSPAPRVDKFVPRASLSDKEWAKSIRMR